MKKKVTWQVVMDSFKKEHPILKKKVIGWRPYNFATIILTFKDGEKATYNYDTKEVVYLKGEN